MPSLPPRRPTLPKPPARFKSESDTERAARLETPAPDPKAKKMSDKDIALAYLVILLQDAAKHPMTAGINRIAGSVRDTRLAKIRGFISKYSEKMTKRQAELLTKHEHGWILGKSFIDLTAEAEA